MPWFRRTPRHQRVLHIRPLTRHDRATIETVFAGLGESSRHQRFHTGVPRLRPSMLDHLLDLRPGRHVGFVALLDERPVGIARWIRTTDEADTAEFAIEVVDAVQGRGIGRELFQACAHAARICAVREFTFYVCLDNHRMRSWLRASGASQHPDDPLEYRLDVAAVTDLLNAA